MLKKIGYPKEQQKKNHTNKILLVAIFFAGLIIRGVYLYFFKDTAYFNPLLMDGYDQKTFLLWAQQILKHPWYVSGEPFYMTPLYAYFLALLHLLSGGNLVVISLIQLLMDVFLCLMLYYVGKTISDDWVGIIAAFLGLFYLTSIVYASSILSDGLIYFLYIAFIALIYYSLQTTNLKRWILTGVVLGLAALAKPTIAIFLPFLLIGLYLYPEKKFLPFTIKEQWQPLTVFLLLLGISGLVILPITIRNYYVSGMFVPICTNGLVNWKIGNSADSLGLFHYPAEKLLSPLSLAFWKLFFIKAGIFFTSYEWPQNLNVYLIERIIPSLKFAFIRFGFIVPVGIAGLLVMFRDWKRNFIFITFTVTNVLWVVLFFITERFRLPAVGCFSICSGYFIVWVIERLKAKQVLQPLLMCCFAGFFAFLFNTKPGPLLPDVSWQGFVGLSIKNIQYNLQQNNTQSAHIKALTYYKLLPNDFKATFLLAQTFYLQGNNQETIFMLNRTLELNPDFTLAKEMLNELIDQN